MSAEKAIILLKKLISTPSISREEDKTADILQEYLIQSGNEVHRKHNNIWTHGIINEDLPTVLLNSHHDTVKPVNGWESDPFSPLEKDDIIIGLGSNDAGASVVSLIETYLYFRSKQGLPFNLVLLLSGEEEISGHKGVESVLADLPDIDLGIVGEPTKMDVAIAEKGLIVVDAFSKGLSGHAAREEGENAIYKALEDIRKISEFQFEKGSEKLGPVKLSVTQIEAGTQHNVVPDQCHFVIDIRTNEHYTNQEIIDKLKNELKSELSARSLRLNSSGLPQQHPLWDVFTSLGIKTYGSPTLSDQALMDFPTIKMGPGDSSRSHTSGEYIRKEEIKNGIQGYIELLSHLTLNK